MMLNRKVRIVHYWLSFFVAIPLLIVIVTGAMLMLKKQFEWIQPPTQSQSSMIFHQDLAQIISVLKQEPSLNVDDLRDIERIDIQPAKGIAKIILVDSSLEVQLRLSDYHILQTQIRRSDFIESLHDGSYFGSFIKYSIFLTAAMLLFVQLITGLYLIFITEKIKASKKRLRGISHES